MTDSERSFFHSDALLLHGTSYLAEWLNDFDKLHHSGSPHCPTWTCRDCLYHDSILLFGILSRRQNTRQDTQSWQGERWGASHTPCAIDGLPHIWWANISSPWPSLGLVRVDVTMRQMPDDAIPILTYWCTPAYVCTIHLVQSIHEAVTIWNAGRGSRVDACHLSLLPNHLLQLDMYLVNYNYFVYSGYLASS